VSLDVTGGPARLLVDAPPGGARAADEILVLGHGAGGGPDALDLQALADRLPAHGYLVLRFEQPWRLAGRGVAAAPAQLRVLDQLHDGLRLHGQRLLRRLVATGADVGVDRGRVRVVDIGSQDFDRLHDLPARDST